MTTQLLPIDPIELQEIQNYIEKHPIENNKYRVRVGVGRSQTWGIVAKRSEKPDLSRNTWKHAHLHFLLMSFAKKHIQIPFTSIQVNEGFQCGLHIDKNNIGMSYIIAFGDYEGGELEVSNKVYNIRYTPLLFDGSKEFHKTLPFTGKRYSIVYHTLNPKPVWLPIKSIHDYEAIQIDGKWVIKCSDGTILTKKSGLPHKLKGYKRKPLTQIEQ